MTLLQARTWSMCVCVYIPSGRLLFSAGTSLRGHVTRVEGGSKGTGPGVRTGLACLSHRMFSPVTGVLELGGVKLRDEVKEVGSIHPGEAIQAG